MKFDITETGGNGPASLDIPLMKAINIVDSTTALLKLSIKHR